MCSPNLGYLPTLFFFFNYLVSATLERNEMVFCDAQLKWDLNYIVLVPTCAVLFVLGANRDRHAYHKRSIYLGSIQVEHTDAHEEILFETKKGKKKKKKRQKKLNKLLNGI